MNNIFKKTAAFFIKIFVFFISILEAPAFLLLNPRIYRNNIVYVFWHWSFGHEISGLDYASRLYYPYRISLVYIPHPRSNPYLPLCFQHNMDVFFYRSIIPPLRGQLDMAKYDVLRFYLLFLSGLTKAFQVLEPWTLVYKALSVAKGNLKIGCEKTSKLREGVDWTGYIHLLHSDIGVKPKLPKNLEEQCREAIKNKYSDFFSKPFIILLLREKGRNSRDFIDSIRCCGPQENYRKAVKYLTGEGFHVVGMGEVNHKIFSDTPGYYDLSHAGVDYRLLNLYCLMNCKLFIGQHSGPLNLANSCGVPVVLVDTLPFWQGTFSETDIILHKHLIRLEDRTEINTVSIYREHADLAYGYNYEKKGIILEPDTPEEILEAVKEGVLLVKGNIDFNDEDRKLIRAFQDLVKDKSMVISYTGNHPAIFALRKMKDELLFDPNPAFQAGLERVKK